MQNDAASISTSSSSSAQLQGLGKALQSVSQMLIDVKQHVQDVKASYARMLRCAVWFFRQSHHALACFVFMTWAVIVLPTRMQFFALLSSPGDDCSFTCTATSSSIVLVHVDIVLILS
jgi:hypothetical protein